MFQMRKLKMKLQKLVFTSTSSMALLFTPRSLKQMKNRTLFSHLSPITHHSSILSSPAAPCFFTMGKHSHCTGTF